MESTKYYEGMLIIAKQGTNPWWPGKVVRCKKTNKCTEEVDMNVKVYVNFLEINIKTWINTQNILRILNKEKMDLFLEARHCSEPENTKYVNNVPSAMEESYEKAWEKYNVLLSQSKDEIFFENDVEMMDLNENLSKKLETREGCSPCEVCISKEIEYNCGVSNKRLLSLSIIDRSLQFSKVIIAAGESVFQCDNQCVWKYHSRCVSSNEDLVCACNKSSWHCSICDEPVPVEKLFMCNNYECMRAYHKGCLATYLELQPDMKQCPLHHCVNCRLDDLATDDVASLPLTYCVKCKSAFHSHRDCLPLSFMTVTDRYIICGRHFLDQGSIADEKARFCFTCASPTDNDAISCSYCLVTYHNRAPCFPAWIEHSDDGHFVCTGCKFPYVRRWRYAVLAQTEPGDTDNCHSWKVGVPMGPSNDCKSVVIRDGRGAELSVPLGRLVAVNLQSLEHLVIFGQQRFKDMQAAILHLSSLVSSVAEALSLQQSYRRNAFVLHFSGLFPLTENIYRTKPEIGDGGKEASSNKCVCNIYCSTVKCPNVAGRRECTESSCSDSPRCRNRRIQRRQYPRHKLIVATDRDVPYVVLEEAVVKDVLVMELVGEVHKRSQGQGAKDQRPQASLFRLSSTEVLDNGRFCGLSRFVHHSDSGNLVSKSWTVAGLPRIGLFSCRRIAANERLTLDMRGVLLDESVSLVSSSLSGLVSWTDMEAAVRDGGAVIDLCCDNDNDNDNDGRDSGDYDDGDNGGAIDDSDLGSVSLVSKAPLCPLCLQELLSQYHTQRAMVHCVHCFTVHHLQCAYDSLTASRTQCRLEKDPRLMRFVCHLCRRLDNE